MVSNQKLNNLLGLADDVELKGSTARELGRQNRQRWRVSQSNAENLVDRLTTKLSGSEDAAFRIETLKHSSLEFTMQPMENGGMVALVEDITERMVAEARINHLARFDALTGLPNRTVLRDRMEHALGAWRPDKMCAIHFIDLDQFKQINDTLGTHVATRCWKKSPSD